MNHQLIARWGTPIISGTAMRPAELQQKHLPVLSTEQIDGFNSHQPSTLKPLTAPPAGFGNNFLKLFPALIMLLLNVAGLKAQDTRFIEQPAVTIPYQRPSINPVIEEAHQLLKNNPLVPTLFPGLKMEVIPSGGYQYEFGNRKVVVTSSKCCGGVPAYFYYQDGQFVNLRYIKFPKELRQPGGGPTLTPEDGMQNVMYYLMHGFTLDPSKMPRA